MRYNRKGKIVATIGPATNSPENLEKLCFCGVDVFRLNFSHGTHDDHAKVYSAIRTIGQKHRIYPTILADLQGPKLRIGTFEKGKVLLKEGEVFRLDLNPEKGDSRRVYFPHAEILAVFQVGTLLLLDDGKLKMEVVAVERTFVDAKVLVGGQLSDRKGINIPNIALPVSNLTEKDLKDLDFAMYLGVDWVALSFVQSVEDVEKAKSLIKGRAGIISKLEKPLAIAELEPIVDASDALMIARGDLGVEVNQEDLPGIQRNVVKVCRKRGRPVIVATQMLESMISSPVPTRAEVSDVANAIYQGADAVMLSAETASGLYPFEAVKIMNKIIEKTESDTLKAFEGEDFSPQKMMTDAVCVAAKNTAEYSDAVTIVMFSNSFEAACRCARLRPTVAVVFVTESQKLAGKIGICCGIFAIVAKKEFEVEQMNKTAKYIASELKYASAGDNIIVLDNISGNSVTICKL
ncbi:MAG: pyruvate kinase [Holosporaceae bacterium]|jgi:pyruvate kinase|nr:pyruvate kinase [Holosporaceae bacterium]